MSIVSTADNKGDTIFSDGYKVTITAGSGNDIIYNDHGAYSTIDCGAGKDWIANNDSHVSIRASADNKGDEIFNLGSNVTITAGGGKDTIENHGDKVTIKSGAGKDYIGNNGSNVKIYSTADSIGDSIFNGQIDPAYQAGGDKVTIAAGNGNDVIRLYSGESVENLLKSALTPLINAAKDYNLKKINALIDKYNSLMKNVDGFVELSQLKYSYKDKHQIELRDQLKKISSQGGSLYDELEKAEKFLGNAGVDTYKVSMMKKSVGKINKISGKAVKAIDNMEIGVGVVKEYIDDKTFQTFAKEMTSDFEKDANGRIVAVWEKDYNNPATVRAGAGNDIIYGDERTFHVYEYTAGDGKDVIYG